MKYQEIRNCLANAVASIRSIPSIPRFAPPFHRTDSAWPERILYPFTPRRKHPDKYLFDGELWITAGDDAIAKMSGRPAKALSFWIDDANFVREYQRVGGFWLPIRDQTVVEGKVNEKRVLRVEHQHYVINAAHRNSAEEVRLLVSGRN